MRLKYGTFSATEEYLNRIPEELIEPIIISILNHPRPYTVYTHNTLKWVLHHLEPTQRIRDIIENALVEYEQGRI